jgi:hypothetical protein
VARLRTACRPSVTAAPRACWIDAALRRAGLIAEETLTIAPTLLLWGVPVANCARKRRAGPGGVDRGPVEGNPSEKAEAFLQSHFRAKLSAIMTDKPDQDDAEIAAVWTPEAREPWVSRSAKSPFLRTLLNENR